MKPFSAPSLLCVFVSSVFFTFLFIDVGAGDGYPSWFYRRKPHQPTPLKEGLSYKTFYYEQPVDNFGFVNHDTYKQRYLVSDQFWNRNGGPIFFYTGNEGDIEWFCNNTGFMWDIAPEFKALIVFAEHRYYGKSMPYGPNPFKHPRLLNFLTSEQALADFARLIRYMKTIIPGAEKSPVVAFGGSYGGMLAAWLRMKYPNVVVGSLAASAPILQFTGITPCNVFYDIVSATWKNTNPTCAENIHKSYQVFADVSSAAGGYEFIRETFKLCTMRGQKDVDALIDALVTVYVQMAEVDYPYPSNFLANLPGWPIHHACKPLSSPLVGKALLKAMSSITTTFFNYTGDLKCLDLSASSPQDHGAVGWDYQACTEMVMPLCSNGSGIIYDIPYSFDSFSEQCQSIYDQTPRRDWIKLQYWGTALKSASNIIFSNGELDPWSGGGVRYSISDSVVAIRIPEGAHHLDLRHRNPKDTQYVIAARKREVNIIKKWLKITPDS